MEVQLTDFENAAFTAFIVIAPRHVKEESAWGLGVDTLGDLGGSVWNFLLGLILFHNKLHIIDSFGWTWLLYHSGFHSQVLRSWKVFFIE